MRRVVKEGLKGGDAKGKGKVILEGGWKGEVGGRSGVEGKC